MPQVLISLLWNVFQCQFHFQNVCSVKYICSMGGSLSGQPGTWVVSYLIVQFSKTMECFQDQVECMCSLGVRLKIHKQLYAVTFMKSFLFYLLCTLWFQEPSLLGYPESWNFINPGVPHITHGYVWLWNYKIGGYKGGEKAMKFCTILLRPEFFLSQRKVIMHAQNFSFLQSPISVILVPPLPSDCFGAGMWENGEKEKKNGGTSSIFFGS